MISEDDQGHKRWNGPQTNSQKGKYEINLVIKDKKSTKRPNNSPPAAFIQLSVMSY
jgi:hypothetical protein